MNVKRQILLLALLAVVSAAVAALLHQPWALGESVTFMFTCLSLTFMLSLIATWRSAVRHDFITVAVGLPSALACGLSLFSIIFLTVPFIGAAIGRDLRKHKIKTEANKTSEASVASAPQPQG